MLKTYSSHNFPLVRDKPPEGARICETGLLHLPKNQRHLTVDFVKISSGKWVVALLHQAITWIKCWLYQHWGSVAPYSAFHTKPSGVSTKYTSFIVFSSENLQVHVCNRQELESPLIKYDLEKGTRDLKHLTYQGPAYIAFQVDYDKIFKFHISWTWNHNSHVRTLLCIDI